MKSLEEINEGIQERNFEKTPRGYPDGIPQDMFKEIPKGIPRKIYNRIPDGISPWILDGSLRGILEKILIYSMYSREKKILRNRWKNT